MFEQVTCIRQILGIMNRHHILENSGKIVDFLFQMKKSISNNEPVTKNQIEEICEYQTLISNNYNYINNITSTGYDPGKNTARVIQGLLRLAKSKIKNQLKVIGDELEKKSQAFNAIGAFCAGYRFFTSLNYIQELRENNITLDKILIVIDAIVNCLEVVYIIYKLISAVISVLSFLTN